MNQKYQLRYAAGLYWLLQMDQSGEDGLRPVILNECGAYIWDLSQKGNRLDQIVRQVCEKYGILEAEALADVTEFLDTLHQQGIMEQG